MNKQSLTDIRSGKQNNHEDFSVPPEISHLGDLPLYRAVAWWGLLRGSAFSRGDVSEAFHIDLRRASGILHYICHRNEGNDITFEVRRIPIRGGRSQLMMRILAVSDKSPADGKRVGRKPGKKKDDRDRLLSRWLLSRPKSGDIVSIAAWKAACPVDYAMLSEEHEEKTEFLDSDALRS
ncbi:CaiF/GrlA family transcriptional regulator [Intestinirhabdus alba]|jgi:hypothetical protein|uniref:CaiF/GrlA family transcriptional regulator n=1 Tax=Intestinirhabdus alba TaxID=2899544 RepID=A0A6L6IK21_9ENTR|nr:CaiF/GrlA family transcriptional regulator [Intestinirhabdus alba]MTH46058.1 CaiF/GrlA family transcriptional regulator [Intestinirhabdus alba]